METTKHTATLNGRTGKARDVLRPWINALNDSAIVMAKGGYLFKGGWDGTRLMLEVIPLLTEGQRGFHHTLKLDTTPTATLIGQVDAHGGWTLIAQPHGDPEDALRAAIRFAQQLEASGYKGKGRLDEVTISTMEELGALPPPVTLSELARLA